ncbi:unnamed protein product [Moneuplotes crassus]|uniref:Uncharacterized protein n=1 Tax=Euplotes crassus TaxID=5936 RepID=A0AAD1XH74_EUPCR|nr:unnamed protein product [Moneuplotes crassus]
MNPNSRGQTCLSVICLCFLCFFHIFSNLLPKILDLYCIFFNSPPKRTEPPLSILNRLAHKPCSFPHILISNLYKYQSEFSLCASHREGSFHLQDRVQG